MTINELLKIVHRKYESGSTDYPAAGTEDKLFRIDAINDGIRQWEAEGLAGEPWRELIQPYSAVLTGTGTDDLPDDYVSTIKGFNKQSPIVKIGSTIYRQVSHNEGLNREKQNKTNENVFWVSGGNLRTFPHANGTLEMDYQKRATTYETGDETQEIEMSQPQFLVHTALAALFAYDRDAVNTQLQYDFAVDIVNAMKEHNLQEFLEEDQFGFGM